ncbi:MAG: hypothetical protein K0R84_581 [Clostridia bacterium]|jgi:hypothetical protein|nr:hypothetical protein [Clostridia bacterium]
MKDKTYDETLSLVNSINNYREEQQNEIINQCGELMEDYFTPIETQKNIRGSK